MTPRKSTLAKIPTASASILLGQSLTLCDTGRELLAALGNQPLTPEELNALAAKAGFKGGLEMFRFTAATYGLPFEGRLIESDRTWLENPDPGRGAVENQNP